MHTCIHTWVCMPKYLDATCWVCFCFCVYHFFILDNQQEGSFFKNEDNLLHNRQVFHISKWKGTFCEISCKLLIWKGGSARRCLAEITIANPWTALMRLQYDSHFHSLKAKLHWWWLTVMCVMKLMAEMRVSELAISLWYRLENSERTQGAGLQLGKLVSSAEGQSVSVSDKSFCATTQLLPSNPQSSPRQYGISGCNEVPLKIYFCRNTVWAGFVQ